MKSVVRSLLICAIVSMFPVLSNAQFSALRWVDVPTVGSWAKYVRTQTIGIDKTYMVLQLSVVGEKKMDGVEYIWFELSSHIDALYEIADDRVPFIARFYIKKDDLNTCEPKLIEKMGDLVIKLGDRDAMMIPKRLTQQAIEKGYLSGGSQGSASCIDYKFGDDKKETVEAEAGRFKCTYRSAVGNSRVITNLEAKRTADIESKLQLWINEEVPFGIVKSVNHIYGKGPEVGAVSLTIDTEETYTLKAYGTGATTTIKSKPKPYSLEDVSSKVEAP